MKPFVFVSGPYTRDDPVLNVRTATKVADVMLTRGFVPFVPHLCHLWHLISPKDYDRWLEYDLDWLRKCDVLYRITGESAGADEEVKFARILRTPVFFTFQDIFEWKRADGRFR